MKALCRSLIILFVLLGVSVITWCAFTFTEPAPPPSLPDPNGYDDLVKAGKMLGDDLPGFQELRDMDEADLRATLTNSLSSHAEALALAKIGLSRKSRVRLNYVATSSAHLEELSAIKSLSRVFITLGRLAEFEDRNTTASEFYLGLIRLGHESARGGTLLDSMSGRVTEAVGLGYLEKLAPKLDAKTCRESALVLETIDERSGRIEDVIRQEKEWIHRAYGIKGQFMRLFAYQSLKKAEQAWVGRMKTQQTHRQSPIIKLSMRAHELDTGHAPERLEQLVPDYIRHLPEGSSSNEPASYRMQNPD